MATRRPTEPPRSSEAPKEIPKVVKADETAAVPQARKKAAPRAKAASVKPPLRKPVPVSEDVRRGMIAEAAYLRAEKRGFAPGGEEEDWLAAEAEVDALLGARAGETAQ